MKNTEEFAKILRDANGVWFDGGRQWNIVDSYANTLTYREFTAQDDRVSLVADGTMPLKAGGKSLF